jgi:mono/diheme cytochrome c family protein
MKKIDWTYAPLFGTVFLSMGICPQMAWASDVKNGEQLARRWCVTCHLVAADQSRADADVPSFSSIAERPSFKSETIANFLLDPHPKMPSFTLSRKEADDIAEYIASLADKQRKPNPAPLDKRRSSL